MTLPRQIQTPMGGARQLTVTAGTSYKITDAGVRVWRFTVDEAGTVNIDLPTTNQSNCVLPGGPRFAIFNAQGSGGSLVIRDTELNTIATVLVGNYIVLYVSNNLDNANTWQFQTPLPFVQSAYL